jgi:dTDP-4-dehydrorhamnose 3,5-epimerase
MKVAPTDHPEVMLVEPAVFNDARGFFKEMFHAEKYQANGLPGVFVQDNHSRSAKGVLRGLHYQLNQPQGKLVSVVAGEVFDVAVDIRKGSPRFGQWVGVRLSGENHRQLYIPPGFAHGFCVLSESADFLYKCTDFYLPGDEYGIIWNDPDIGIEWPRMDFQLSDSDRVLPRLSDSGYLPLYQPTGQ